MNRRSFTGGLLSLSLLVAGCGPSMDSGPVDGTKSSQTSLVDGSTPSVQNGRSELRRAVDSTDDAGLTAPAGSCEVDDDCANGDFCSAGVCKARALNGGACASSAECSSGSCVDGVCCNVACDGECETCTARGSVGTCAPVNGPSCSHCQDDGDCTDGDFCSTGICKPRALNGGACTDADQCGSGSCAGGVCCDTPCDGEGETCTGRDSVGTCTVAAGA